MLDLRRLQLLRELAQRGTITAVARAHSFSTSAISQQLSSLEREAGVRLLEPSGRRVRLTAQGELLVERAEVLLEEMERTEVALARSRSTATATGTLRVASFQSAVLALVPAVITHLGRQFPGLRLEVTELEPEVALPALESGTYDVVLAEEYPRHPLPISRATERRALLEDELRLVTPSSWEGTCPADFATRPFVMEPIGTAAREWATATCREAGFEPDVRYTSTDLQIHLKLIQSGHAAALLPDLSGPLDHPAVVAGALPGQPHRQVLVVNRRGAGEDPRIEAFATALRSHYPMPR